MDSKTNLRQWLQAPLPLSPIYFIVGEEGFLISEIKKTLIRHIHKDKSLMDFNHDEMDCSGAGAEKLVSLAETLPVMSAQRLIFCGSAHRLGEKDWSRLAPLIQKPSSSAVTAFFFDKKDSRRKHFKLLQKSAKELPAAALRDWETGPWIDFLARREGLRFSPSSRALFSELAGTGLLEISGEIKKLKTYMGGRTDVRDEDLTAVVSRARIDSVFDLTEAIGKKDLSAALSCLARLLTKNQSESGALALVARHIRILSKLQEGQKRRLPKAQLIALTGAPPIFLKKYQSQSSLWTKGQIESAMEALYETDKAIKSSPLSSHIWLENFILKACAP